jgi:hypothetical protein
MTEPFERIWSEIGWQSDERTHVVEAGHVSRFAEAVGDPDPRWTDFAPPTFLASMLQEPPEYPTAWEYGVGWLNGGDRFEYLDKIHVGDQLRSRSRLVDAYEKQGSSGQMLFLIFETDFRNPDDQTVVRHTGTRIRR